MASRKGSPNKITSAAKDNILAVFNRLGGTAGMAEWAMDNKTEFYKLWAKLLPRDFNVEGKISVVDDLSERLARARETVNASREPKLN